MAIVFLISLATTLIVFHPRQEPIYPTHYTYMKLRSADGIVLHMMETRPDNIQLVPIESNVTAAPFYGINGGFFWEGYLLSIAVKNGRPVKGEPEQYGSGWFNRGVDSDLRRGTLVWDEAAQRFSVQVAADASELRVTDPRRFWAQGGVSMGLDRETSWEASMIEEQMPAYDEERLRSGLVYDTRQNVYMIVTPTPCTVPQFRAAILETLGHRGLLDGIFLDGDGSSQLRSKQVRLAGDNRPVYQMLALIN